MKGNHRSKRKARERSPSAAVTAIVLDRGHAWVISGLLSLGLVISLYLTYVHYRLHADPGWRSVCDIEPELSCDAVVLSPYGSIRGMPLSVFSAWFYLVGIVVVIAARRGSRWQLARSPAVVLLAGGAVATALSLGLAVISIVAIGSLCPLCTVLDVINVGVTVIAWRAIRRTGENVTRALHLERVYWRAKRGRFAVASLAALGVLGLGLYNYSHSAGGSTICDAVARADSAGRQPVELVAYSDFQCPHCRDVARALRPILREGGIRFVLGHYPLDGACNQNVKYPRHPGSCRQALAAICAGMQGRAIEYSDALVDGRASVNGEVDLAVSLGLDGPRFEACLASEEASRILRDSIAGASARDVHATPTLFVNGTRHVGRLDDSDLRCLANAASWPRRNLPSR